MLERVSLAWLIARLRNRQYSSDRRLAAAQVVMDCELRVDLVRVVG